MSKSFDITPQIDDILEEVMDDVKDVTNKEIKRTARDAAQKLKATSPRNEGGKRAGRYANGWKIKQGDGETIVYNATDWQLTHLLENGHAVVNRYGDTGARASAIKHIEPVEQWASDELPMRIIRGLK